VAKTNLSRVLDIMEDYRGPLSLGVMARELGQSPERTREYVEYWIRRGRIQESGGMSDCSACGQKSGCPFIMDGPKTYQLSDSCGDESQISCSVKFKNS
jgi:hypothetical protein